MQPVPINGNKSESAGAIRQPKLVSIFLQCEPIYKSTPVMMSDDVTHNIKSEPLYVCFAVSQNPRIV